MTLLGLNTLTFHHKYYGFTAKTEGGLFTDHSFCTFTPEVIYS